MVIAFPLPYQRLNVDYPPAKFETLDHSVESALNNEQLYDLRGEAINILFYCVIFLN